MTTHSDSLEPTVPLPAAYTRQISYGQPRTDPSTITTCEYVDLNTNATANGYKKVVDETSLDEISLEEEKSGTAEAKARKPLFRWLSGSRILIRLIAILIMITSFSLILTAVIMFEKHGKPVPGSSSVTDYPCRVFAGIATMNLVLSIGFLLLSCISSKFRKSNNAVNAVFTIISAAGFASSMGACFFLSKENTAKQDLWRWACKNHENGTVTHDLDFKLICNVINEGWKLGLVQASFELLTFIISIAVWVWLRWTFFARYGVFGSKLF